jgi:Protein of unknown function (DUF429)
MVTLGVDLASQPVLTGVCKNVWKDGGASVTELCTGVDDRALKSFFESETIDKIGVDVPLGWPEKFVEAISQHHVMSGWVDIPFKQLRYRATDQFVNDQIGGAVLSVSSDRIAVPAFRAANLMAQLTVKASRDGSGKLCEVYPAGALCRWGLPYRMYKKRKNIEARRKLVREILAKAHSWLLVPDDYIRLCEINDDALDSLVASLVARAQASGLTERVPDQLRNRASLEGWIALPLAGSFDKLPN